MLRQELEFRFAIGTSSYFIVSPMFSSAPLPDTLLLSHAGVGHNSTLFLRLRVPGGSSNSVIDLEAASLEAGSSLASTQPRPFTQVLKMQSSLISNVSSDLTSTVSMEDEDSGPRTRSKVKRKQQVSPSDKSGDESAPEPHKGKSARVEPDDEVQEVPGTIHILSVGPVTDVCLSSCPCRVLESASRDSH
jgi:hypothetical protein